MTTQEQMLGQVYGILDDWKAQQFGGEPIVEAINSLTAAPVRRRGRNSSGSSRVCRAWPRCSRTSRRSRPAARGVVLHRHRSVGRGPGEDPRERRGIAVRMGKKLGTGDEAVEIGPPDKIVLSDFDPILPVPIRPGGDATVYGAGLDAVTDIQVDSSPATIRRRLREGDVGSTVPVGVWSGSVDVVVVLDNGHRVGLSRPR